MWKLSQALYLSSAALLLPSLRKTLIRSLAIGLSSLGLVSVSGCYTLNNPGPLLVKECALVQYVRDGVAVTDMGVFHLDNPRIVWEDEAFDLYIWKGTIERADPSLC